MYNGTHSLWINRVRTIALYFCSILALLLIYTFELEAQTPLKVGIIGDQTFSNDLQKSYQILARGIEILSKENVACVLHTGDLLESSVSPKQYRTQFAQATKLLDRLGKPWHLAPGDHDVNPPQYVQNSSDRSREELFRELYRQREPQLTNNLNHSFDLEGYHFIALNSQDHLHVDPRWGDVFLDRLSVKQYAWLEGDLAKHRDAKGIIVFIHQPMWYNWSGWMPVHQLLRRYPVLAVIAGHFHYNQDEGELDNIRYFVVGAAGGNVKQGSREVGHSYHVTVMTIKGRRVEFRLIPIDGSGPLRIMPRADMDRIQAIDTLLGELFDFGSQNIICLKDSRLYSQKTEPAKLSLIPLGNPIDLPVKVSVNLLGDKLSLVNPHFAANTCQQMIGNVECILAPGTRIESSNTSSVILNNRFAPLPPLWESSLTVINGKTISVGDTIQLNVRLSLQTTQGEQFVERLATTKIAACPQ